MTTLLLNKPFGVLSQFTPEEGSRWGCLSDFVDVPQVYAAGRLDADSEGLLILTSNGRLPRDPLRRTLCALNDRVWSTLYSVGCRGSAARASTA